MKSSVRFQAAPIVFNQQESNHLDDSGSSCHSDNLDLLKALNLDEFSTAEVNEDKTIFEDSMYNRVNFVGRTPHSKVVEAKKERKALQELMKVPAFANNHYKSDFSVLEKNQSIIQSNMNGNKTDAQSRLLASTNSVKSSYSDTSYHFELVQQQPPIQDEEENYQPRVAVSFAKSASLVHFDEQNLAQNRLETPAASRKIPLRKTPAPQKLLSHEKSLTNSRITVEDLAPPNSVRPVPNQDSFEEVTKDSIILNNSMEISGISPANHQTNFASSINSASSGSPLASLISRPEVSKASPIVSPAQIVIKKEMSDAATSYSPPTVPKVTQTSEILINSKRDAATSYSYDVKTLQGSRSVTSESSLKPDLSSVSQESKSSLQSTSTVSSSADTIQMQLAQGKLYQPLTEGESAVNHTARSYAVPENNLRSASPWSLAKDGGVAFGRGPILSNIAHSVASIKQVVHHVASTVTEIPVLPKVNNHPNQVITTTQLVATTSITQDPETETIHSQTSSGSTDEACRMKPALDWFSPRHTRKPAPLHPSQFPFTPQTHHLQTNYLGDDVSRSSTGSSLSHSMQLQSIRVDKPLIMKSEQWKTAKICDVSVQVESEMLTSGITEVTKRKESLDEESSFDRSYTLEELMQSAATTNNSSTLQQFDDSRSTWQQRNLSKQSLKGLFDFTSCNIGGSPSTITNHFMDSRVNQSHNSSTPLQHTPSSAYSTSLSYTTIPSLHSDFQQEYIQRQSSTKAPSSLGKPGRVPLTVEKEEYIQAVWGNEEDEIIQNYQYCDQSHQDTIEEAVMFQPEGKYSSADVTILTDVAIANFTRDQQRSLEQYEDDYSIPTTSTSFLSNGLETTMTIDHSYMAKQESSPNNAEPFPRLAIRSLKRDAQNPFDIKEIGFETSPNELMTIMLTLKNDQKEGKTIKLTSKTIFLRVEPLYSQRSSNSDHNALEEFLTEEEKDQIFTVSPEVLEIPSKEEGMIFITFAPKKEGIYSGVLKITYRKKSFTLLLRGESSQQFSCQQLQSIANSQVVSTVQKQSKQSQVPSSVSFNSQNYQNSPETLQSVPPTTSKLNTSACFSSTIDSTNIRAISGIPTTPNDWTNEISPNTFQSKLRVLQKKIGEISNKITLKDTIHPRSSAFDKPIDMALTLPPSAQQKNNFFKQKKEELFLLQSNHSSAPPYSVNSKLSSSINYQADSEKSSLKRMVTKRITSSVTENSNLSISQGIAIPSPSVKSTTPSEWQQPMVVATVHSRNLVLEEQEMMIKKESVSQTNDRRSSEEVKATNNMELITTDNQEEYLLNATKRKGLFFRKEVERFGYTMIGSLVRTKIVLCNASHHEITVYFGDVEAPFYNHHSEVKMRPKSFVRVPIRFVPTQPGQYEQELIAQTADGKLHAVVRLVGTAASSTPYKS